MDGTKNFAVTGTTFILFSFVYMDSFDITEQVSLLTRLTCGHKTCSMTECREAVLVRVTRWSMWLFLGLFSRVGAPSYSYRPVHFLGLGTTSCGLPFIKSRTFRHCSHNRHVVSSTGFDSRTFWPVPNTLPDPYKCGGQWIKIHLCPTSNSFLFTALDLMRLTFCLRKAVIISFVNYYLLQLTNE